MGSRVFDTGASVTVVDKQFAERHQTPMLVPGCGRALMAAPFRHLTTPSAGGGRESGAPHHWTNPARKNGSMLHDLLRPGLSVVFCGTAIATASADRGHYYSGRGNKFWQLLHDAGFTPVRLRPEEDATLPDYGVGMTDLVKDVAQSHDRGLDFAGTAAVAAHIVTATPNWVAFNGQTAGRAAASQLGLARKKDIRLGEQTWRIGTSRVFVLPSSSGAHATMPYGEKLTWWRRLC